MPQRNELLTVIVGASGRLRSYLRYRRQVQAWPSLGLLATAHRSDEKTGLDARLDPEWHPVWSGSSLAKDAAASMAGLSTGPRTSKVRRASQQRSAGGRPSGELILGARTARKFCVRDAWRRSLLERPIVKALEHLPVVLTMSENLAEKIAARTGVDPAKVVEVVQLALEELHRLTVVGDKGPTDAAMETCFSGEAAFHFIGILAMENHMMAALTRRGLGAR